MIYLDNGATSFNKPPTVALAILKALENCGNPGRGGHAQAMEAAQTVYACRRRAAQMFHCLPEQVVFTANCTHGLNIAINTLVKKNATVVISGFEHNAVTRVLHGIGARVVVAGRRLFDWQDTLQAFEVALKAGADAAVFTHVSNVFGYILPVEEMAALCRRYQVPFILDAAQSAGILPISLQNLGADFIAMPGHKGLLGPQGTGILLCGRTASPLLRGGTGTQSLLQTMPEEPPESLEAGTLNVPGIAGLHAGMQFINQVGMGRIFRAQQTEAAYCAERLQKMGLHVFLGDHQAGTVSFVPTGDGEQVAHTLAQKGIAVRAGLHCAPLAHESAGTLQTGTVRVSFGHDANARQTGKFIRTMKKLVYPQ